jgi:putative Holliday junction resolvase
MERALGLDLGARRVGVAISGAGVATPYEVIDRQNTDVARRVKEIVEEENIGRVVVGLPLSLSGDDGPAARAARDEAATLAAALPVPVEVFDERLTTVSAEQSLQEATRMKADARRRVVDKVAAAVMLQAWLEARDV